MRPLATALSALGFLWAAAATVYIAAGVGHEGMSTRFALTGDEGASGYVGVSLASANGVWVVALLAAVTLLAGMPFGVALSYPRGQRATALGGGTLLLGFSLVTAFTVGLFYLPCAIALLAAAAAAGPSGSETTAASNGLEVDPASLD